MCWISALEIEETFHKRSFHMVNIKESWQTFGVGRQERRDTNIDIADFFQVVVMKTLQDIPGGPTLKNLHRGSTQANAGDTGLTPDPGRSHLSHNN